MYQLDDIEYARSRLVDTVVRYKGRAVWVKKIDGDGVCVVEYLATNTRKQVQMAELNLKSVKLGYVNSEHGAQYLVRIPKRNDWRQGVRLANIMFIRPRSGVDTINMRNLAKTIKGTYPSLDDVKEGCRLGSRVCIAWTREWALYRGALFYKGQSVGKYRADRNQLELSRSFVFLKESLMEVA